MPTVSHGWNCRAQKYDFTGSFILDSGASQHVCGDEGLFLELVGKENEESIFTANGVVRATGVGKVRVVLDNGLDVTLHDVYTGEIIRRYYQFRN